MLGRKSSVVFYKLIAFFGVVSMGWGVGKLRWLGPRSADADPARVLANAAYCVFVPALLFRTSAWIDFDPMPWDTLIAVFVPMLLMQIGV